MCNFVSKFAANWAEARRGQGLPAGNKTQESNWCRPRMDGLVRRDEPLNRVTEYAYDAVGNAAREALRDGADPSSAPRVVDARYDALNRKI